MPGHRHALTDQQWVAIEPLLPGKAGDPGRTALDNRRFVDAVLFVAKTGIPWRDLPERFGRWNSVWRRFDRWCAAGVWPALAAVLGEADLSELQLDAMIVRAQQSAAGGRRRLSRAEKKRTPTRGVASDARGAAGRASSTRPSTVSAGSCG